jgi:hypothetical protein
MRPLQLDEQQRCADEACKTGSYEPEAMRPATTSPWFSTSREDAHASESVATGGAVPGIPESVRHTWRSSSDKTGQVGSPSSLSVAALSVRSASRCSSPSATRVGAYHRGTIMKRDPCQVARRGQSSRVPVGGSKTLVSSSLIAVSPFSTGGREVCRRSEPPPPLWPYQAVGKRRKLDSLMKLAAHVLRGPRAAPSGRPTTNPLGCKALLEDRSRRSKLCPRRQLANDQGHSARLDQDQERGPLRRD